MSPEGAFHPKPRQRVLAASLRSRCRCRPLMVGCTAVSEPIPMLWTMNSTRAWRRPPDHRQLRDENRERRPVRSSVTRGNSRAAVPGGPISRGSRVPEKSRFVANVTCPSNLWTHPPSGYRRWEAENPVPLVGRNGHLATLRGPARGSGPGQWPHRLSRPSRCAIAAASPRPSTPSLARM
jgi:hypothetical protein